MLVASVWPSSSSLSRRILSPVFKSIMESMSFVTLSASISVGGYTWYRWCHCCRHTDRGFVNLMINVNIVTAMTFVWIATVQWIIIEVNHMALRFNISIGVHIAIEDLSILFRLARRRHSNLIFAGPFCHFRSCRGFEYHRYEQNDRRYGRMSALTRAVFSVESFCSGRLVTTWEAYWRACASIARKALPCVLCLELTKLHAFWRPYRHHHLVKFAWTAKFNTVWSIVSPRHRRCRQHYRWSA